MQAHDKVAAYLHDSVAFFNFQNVVLRMCTSDKSVELQVLPVPESHVVVGVGDGNLGTGDGLDHAAPCQGLVSI